MNRLLGWLPDKQSLQLVADAWGLLYRNLWAVVAVFLAKDAAAFVLHRLVHRLTNHSEYCSSGSMGSQSVSHAARLITTLWHTHQDCLHVPVSLQAPSHHHSG